MSFDLYKLPLEVQWNIVKRLPIEKYQQLNEASNYLYTPLEYPHTIKNMTFYAIYIQKNYVYTYILLDEHMQIVVDNVHKAILGKLIRIYTCVGRATRQHNEHSYKINIQHITNQRGDITQEITIQCSILTPEQKHITEVLSIMDDNIHLIDIHQFISSLVYIETWVGDMIHTNTLSVNISNGDLHIGYQCDDIHNTSFTVKETLRVFKNNKYVNLHNSQNSILYDIWIHFKLLDLYEQ